MTNLLFIKIVPIDLHANDLLEAQHGRICALEEQPVVSGNVIHAPSNARTVSDIKHKRSGSSGLFS